MTCDWRDWARCRTLPPDWWDLDNDGARLALTLCRLGCPVRRQCAATALNPTGIIRAGVAYADSGQPAAMCPCGRPIPAPRATSTECFDCDPRRDTPMPAPLATGRARQGAVDRWVDTIAELAAAGWTDRAIGVRLGVKACSVRGVRRRHSIASRAPQAGPRRSAS